MKRDPLCRIVLVLLATLAGSAAVLADYALPGRSLSGRALSNRSIAQAVARDLRGPAVLPAKSSAGRGAARQADSSPTQTDGKESRSTSGVSAADTTQDLCSGVTCNDGNPCTADTCDPSTGQCVYSPTP